MNHLELCNCSHVQCYTTITPKMLYYYPTYNVRHALTVRKLTL